MNKKILVFLLIKLWSLIILFTILFIIPFFRSLNDETEISTSIEMGRRDEHQWKNLQKDKNLNLKTEEIKM